MTYQNRVDPFGKFHAVAARGELMGNRGILHDSEQRVQQTHAHQNWIACALTFRGRKRTIMGPGTYTELFFLDEATAYAAGHRPCAECRRQDYKAFAQHWRQVHGEPEPGRALSQTIDRTLHAHRIARNRPKITFQAAAEELPDGTMLAVGDQAVLVWKARQFDWDFTGISKRGGRRDGQLARVSGKSPLGETLRYAVNHWDGLCVFLDDGRVEMGTNAVERCIRPLTNYTQEYTIRRLRRRRRTLGHRGVAH